MILICISEKIVAGIVGIISVIVGVALKMNNNAIAIIGGADGPTSVFVAGKLNSVLVSILLIAIGVVMLIVGAEVEAVCGEITDLEAFKDYLSKYSYAIKKTQEPKPDTSADAFVNSYDDFMKNTSV